VFLFAQANFGTEAPTGLRSEPIVPSAEGFGYLDSRCQMAKATYRAAMRSTQSQLPSGPTLPPVSHGGPEKLP